MEHFNNYSIIVRYSIIICYGILYRQFSITMRSSVILQIINSQLYYDTFRNDSNHA